MDHHTAILTLRELLPEINSGKTPEAVLTKYASDNNLSPAQLERLGQLFNTAKTMTFMKEASSRGGSFEILDVGDMVSNYMDLGSVGDAKMEKAASAPSNLRVAARPTNVPNFYKGQDLVKVASGHPDDEALEKLRKSSAKAHALKEAKEQVVYLDQVDIFRQQLASSIHERVEKFARWIYDEGPEKFRDLERDSLTRPHQNSNALEHIADRMDAKYLGKYERFDMEKAASVKITRDSTGKRDELDALEEDIHLWAGAVDILKSASSDSINNPVLDEDAARLIQNAISGLNPEAAAVSGQTSEEDETEYDPEDQTEGSVESQSGGGQGQSMTVTQHPANKLDDAAIQRNMDAARKKQDAYDTEMRGEDERREKEIVEKLRGAGDKAKGTIKGLGDAAGGYTKNFFGKIMAKPAEDTRRKARDGARRDVGRVAVLQKAILSDPVLSEADPARVVSLYNTLYNANPEMLSDPNILAYMLREAIEYDGVAPHTFADLTKTRKERGDALKEEAVSERQRYSIGGGGKKDK